MSDPGCCVDRRYGSPRGCDEATCMTLPKGLTCGDCGHKYRCVSMFGAEENNTWCGFFPRRFRLAVVSDEPLRRAT